MVSAISILDIALKNGDDIIGELFNDPDERHAFVYGVLAGWAAEDKSETFDKENIPVNLPEKEKKVIRKEYPYYRTGFRVGWVASDRRVQISTGVGASVLAVGRYFGIF